MALLARARELEASGRSIIHMEIGEPDFVTPQPVIDAGIRALSEGKTHYTPATGLPLLRERIADFYLDRYGVKVAPGRIIVTPGASSGLQLALAVLVNPGDKVLMADPGYPCNRNFVYLLNAEPVGIPVDATTGYQPSVEQVEQCWSQDVAALLLASPSNPTGTLLQAETIRQLFEYSQAQGGSLIVDEIYHGLPDIDKLAQNLFLAAPTVAQHAALAAFDDESIAILEARRDEFRERRDFLLPALRELGFDIPVTPDGAFYLYAGCSRFSEDSYAFSNQLLEEAGVAITPGVDFGSNEPGRHVRFAYTTSLENLREGVRRLGEYLNA